MQSVDNKETTMIHVKFETGEEFKVKTRKEAIEDIQERFNNDPSYAVESITETDDDGNETELTNGLRQG